MFTINGDDKEIHVTCGNKNPKEFDISDSNFASTLYNTYVKTIVVDILQEHVELIEKNLEIYWDDFVETLSEFVHDEVIDSYEDTDKKLPLSKFVWGVWNDVFSDTIMNVFLINYLDYDNKIVKCGYSDNKYNDISKPLANKILDVIKNSYDGAMEEIDD